MVIYECHKVVTIRYKDLIIHIIIHECRKGHSDNYNSYIRIYSRHYYYYIVTNILLDLEVGVRQREKKGS